MAITVQGSGSSATTSVTIPAHAAGDLIVIAARGTVAPTAPAAGGTVPTWTTPTNQTGANNSVGWRCAVAAATATNHTSGTWTNAVQMHVLVLRPTSGNTLATGHDPAQGGANNTQTIIYPAHTLTAGKVSNLVIRYGARITADTEVRTDGAFTTGGTWHTEQPATTPTSAVFSKAVTANEGTFTATPAGTNAAYRAGTLEITEQSAAPTPVDGAVLDLIWDTAAEANGIVLDLPADLAAEAVGDVLDLVADVRTEITGDALDLIWDVAAPFSPTSIAGLYAWWDAAQLTGFADNDPVTTWADASGNGRDMTSSGGPLYRTPVGIGNLSGRPGVQFDGTDDSFLATGTAADATRTIFVVAYKYSPTTERTVFSLDNLSASLRSTSTWYWGLEQDSTGGPIGDPTWPSTVPTVVSLVVSSGTAMTGYTNGTSGGSFDPTGAVISAPGMRISGGSSATQQTWYGIVHEVVVYDSALADVDREAVESHLISKWGTLEANAAPLDLVWDITSDDYATQVASDSPVAWWRLGESAGSVVEEVSNTYDGTYVTGGAKGQAGIAGDGDTAVSFDGVDDYATLTTVGNFGTNLRTSTTEFWIKTTSTAFQYVFGIVNVGTSTIFQCALNTRDNVATFDNATSFSIRGNGSTILRGYILTDIYDGNWHHVVWVAQGTSTMHRCWVDGVERTVTSTLTQTIAAPINFDGPLVLGAQNLRGVIEKYAAVTVDEVALYTTRLTESQIQAHFAAANPPLTTAVDGAALNLKWDTTAQIAGNITDLVWDTRATVDGNVTDLVWDTRTSVSGNVTDLVWDVRNTVDAIVLDLVADVRGSVLGNVTDLTWDTRSAIDGGILDFQWDTIAQVAGAITDLVWDARAETAGGILDFVWDLETFGAVNAAPLGVVWDTRATVNGTALGLLADLRGAVDAIILELVADLRTDVAGAIRILQWDTYAERGAVPRLLKWDVRNTTTGPELVVLWDVLLEADAAVLALVWDVALGEAPFPQVGFDTPRTATFLGPSTSTAIERPSGLASIFTIPQRTATFATADPTLAVILEAVRLATFDTPEPVAEFDNPDTTALITDER